MDFFRSPHRPVKPRGLSADARGLMLAEVLIASLVLGIGLVSVFQAFSHVLSFHKRTERLLRLSGNMESAFWEWRRTGRVPQEGAKAGVLIEPHWNTVPTGGLSLTLEGRIPPSSRKADLVLTEGADDR